MAEQDQQTGEKEFEASEHKLRQAREQGNVAQSKEANGFALFIGVALAALLFGGLTSQVIFDQFASILYHADAYSTDIFDQKGGEAARVLSSTSLQIGILLGIVAASVIVSLVAQQAIAFSFSKLKPEFQKISPVENIKKRYGPKGLIDFAKDMAKMLFAGLIGLVFLVYFVREFYGSSAIQMGFFFDFTFAQILALIGCFAAFQFVLAAIDLPIQRMLHAKQLRMTREELKKEVKQNEGDPQLKQQRRERASKVSRGQMLQNVKDATVVMVNPEHYAVALKWDPDGDKAPTCLAKGTDHLAAKIREVAMAHGVPIYRDPPATRSIYALVEVDEEIKREHFAAVAAAIQYVQRVKGDA